MDVGDILAAANFKHRFVHREMDMLADLFRRAGVPEDHIMLTIYRFWAWPRNSQQPVGRMLAYMFAALAGQFKAGRRRYPSPSFINDVKAICNLCTIR